MGKKTADLWMNFSDVSVALDVADSSVLVEGQTKTGMSVRGALLWLVHLVQWLPNMGGLINNGGLFQMALSTRQGLTSLPNLGDDGCLGKFEQGESFVLESSGHVHGPISDHFLPPIPVATPVLSLYTKTNADLAAHRNKLMEVRLGFTTAELDAAAYTEVVETWGW